MLDVKKLRKDFPILKQKINGKPLVYLDNAATTQKPSQVIEAEKDYYERYNSNIHRGLNSLSALSTNAYEGAHEKVAKFINAGSMEEIVFVRNATEGLNLLATVLTKNLTKEDEVVISKMEHHANLVPWLQKSKEKGFKLKFADINSDGTLNLDSLSTLVTSKTKVVSITACSNVLGTVNPIKKISKIVHEKGALFVSDTAAYIPHHKTDVKDLGVDFIAFSGHKMLAPTGSGAVYGRKDLLEKLDPFLTGGDMINQVFLDKVTWNKLPWKFEAGTPDIASGIGLGIAVDYLSEVGMDNIFEHEQSLTKYALEQLSGIDEVSLYGPDYKKRAGIIPFNIDKVHPHDVATILDQYGVELRAGDHCAQPLMRELGIVGAARASLYLYNTKEEIDVLIEAVKKVQKVMKVK